MNNNLPLAIALAAAFVGAAPHAADCMKRLYRYLLGQEAKPEFVYLP